MPLVSAEPRRRAALLAPLVALALHTAPAAADDPAPGYAIQSGLAYPGQSLAATLSTGELITFDGASVDRWAPDGTLLLHLASFDPPRWTGCFALSPDQQHVLLGETGDTTDPLFAPSGDLYLVPLDGSGPAVLSPATSAYLTTLVFNFDAEFEGPTTAVVSAAQGGFGTGNELVRVDVATGATTLLALLDGPSGPLSFDSLGNLWYATQTDAFPPPPGSTDVILWPAPLLAGPGVLTEAEAVVFSKGFDGASDLAWEASTGALLLAENLYSTGTNRIYQVGNSTANSTLLVEGAQSGWISGLEARSGLGPATLHAYQPEGSALVRYLNGGTRHELHPARPQAAFTGPGASRPGFGTLTFEVQGGPPDGELIALIAPAPYGPELSFTLPTVAAPLFSGLNPNAFAVVPGTYSLDATGTGGLSIQHHGSLFGLLAAQAIVFDAQGAPVGTTTGAQL